MSREKVLHLCYSARTLAEVQAAREARSAYLVEHSDDMEVFEVGEMLCMLEEAIQMVGENDTEIPLPDVEALELTKTISS